MSLSDKVAQELPYLRRFARAMSGSQESGDAYVVAMLEALVADQAMFPHDMATRPAVFHTFLKIWGSVGHNTRDTNDQPGQAAPPDRKLASISHRARQAFLLVTVEGFKQAETAQIMAIAPAEVSQLIETAGREIAEQMATTVLIIEDEPLIALDLSDIVTSIGHEVCANATTRAGAVAAFAKHKPGLVLADIQLADGSSGLDAVNDILSSFEVPVIFITAYPERLLTGTRPEPTFLINKPFSSDTVKAIISQALFFEKKASKQAA